jgi:cytochrome d ubiquinol oxidase subunit I
MYVAAFMVTGFTLASAYAVCRLRGRWTRYERTAFAIPLAIAAVASIAQAPIGDWAARDVATSQPLKLAALEGLARTTRGASEHLLGWYVHGRIEFGIGIPRLLSLLAFHDPNAKVIGLDSVAPGLRPPINVVRVSFQLMVGIGTLLFVLALAFLWIRFRSRRLPEGRWFYWVVALAGPLSVVALIAGWVVTEVGRQPWVVYHVMLTSQAVTGAKGIPVGYATLAATYLAVGAGVVWILRRLARAPLEADA